MQGISPLEEVAKRFGETVPGMLVAANAVGLEDHRRMLASHARRVDDSHRAMAKAAGMEDLIADPPESDSNMGGIVVTGDINITNPSAAQQLAPAAPNSAPAAQQSSGVNGGVPGWVKSGLVATGMVGSALGGALLPGLVGNQRPAPQPPAPPPSYTDTNTNYELQIIKDEPKVNP